MIYDAWRVMNDTPKERENCYNSSNENAEMSNNTNEIIIIIGK